MDRVKIVIGYASTIASTQLALDQDKQAWRLAAHNPDEHAPSRPVNPIIVCRQRKRKMNVTRRVRHGTLGGLGLGIRSGDHRDRPLAEEAGTGPAL